MQSQSPSIPRPRTKGAAALARLRSKYGKRWEILHTTDAWHAVRLDPRPSVQGLSAHTAAGLWRDLERIEEAAK